MSGKGSRPRPFTVDRKTFESNWDKIFGKKKIQKKIKNLLNSKSRYIIKQARV
jgi:hypothetical protein